MHWLSTPVDAPGSPARPWIGVPTRCFFCTACVLTRPPRLPHTKCAFISLLCSWVISFLEPCTVPAGVRLGRAPEHGMRARTHSLSTARWQPSLLAVVPFSLVAACMSSSCIRPPLNRRGNVPFLSCRSLLGAHGTGCVGRDARTHVRLRMHSSCEVRGAGYLMPHRFLV